MKVIFRYFPVNTGKILGLHFLEASLLTFISQNKFTLYKKIYTIRTVKGKVEPPYLA